uniref:hypothetical protein n=1 Tax=Nonomuraea pusilla TaxID=46177 RepID=UPI000B32B408|nr:hypothetical protein [Nonomuraea pusilla]
MTAVTPPPRTPVPSLAARARLITDAVPQAVVCRQAAAHLWGLSVLPCPEPEWPVEIAAPVHLPVPDTITYVTALPAADVTQHAGVRLTTRERTALDCARTLPRLDAVAALDQFARRGVDLETLWRHPLNSWHVRDTISMADPGAASPRESWLRVILVDGGLPRPATQVPVPLGHRCVYLDLGWEDYRLGVEYDGREHHTAPGDVRRDADRREELRARGWRVIPVRGDVVPVRAGDLLQVVANALIECGWRPGPDGMTRVLRRIRAARRRPDAPPLRRRRH